MAGELFLQIELFILSFLETTLGYFFKPGPRLTTWSSNNVWNVAFEEHAVNEEEERGCPDALQDFVLSLGPAALRGVSGNVKRTTAEPR